ncbi:MAG: DNA polymerase III subunit delta [Tenericutes bacterium]|jgi:DNA polymerase-3 subunit delta|nr:DNA polymerase III subunit delta [Mycoplasmatota bacterium]
MNKHCYLLYGDNHFSIKEQTNRIFEQFEVPEDAIEVYDFEETGLHIALSNALTLPFLVDKKGVIIRNSSFLIRQGKSTEDEIEDLIRFCSMNVPETIMVIQAPYEKLDGHKKIVKFLKKNIVSEEYNHNKNFNVYDFVKEKLRENELKIEPFALTQFVNRINHDLDSVNNEVTKLISFARDKEIINSEMIMQITSKDIDENIFSLVNALIEKNKVKLMDIYKDLKEINTNEIWMLSTISNKFMEMLHTKSLLNLGYSQKDVMGYFKVSSGRAYYMKKNAEEISYNQLENHISALSDLDYRIKSGQVDKANGLELFLLKA